MTIRIAEQSTEKVKILVSLDQAGSVIDPEAGDAFLAFVALGDAPAGGDWIAAEFEGDGGVEHGVLAAPGKPRGSYDVWARVDLTPDESFRAEAGKLVVY